ncbi:hypothetical protein FB564_1531 [Salinispora arenicola]|nr:hypothetical protein FB564_1531 [Salinispora arenicola]
MVPGHAELVGFRLPDGALSTNAAAPADAVGYRAGCSCGWVGTRDYPATDEGRWMATSEWGGHLRPLLAATPPNWLLNRSDALRDNVAELATTWPLQALGILAQVERWQRPLIERPWCRRGRPGSPGRKSATRSASAASPRTSGSAPSLRPSHAPDPTVACAPATNDTR